MSMPKARSGDGRLAETVVREPEIGSGEWAGDGSIGDAEDRAELDLDLRSSH
jgi:hypothetical protein